MKINYTPLNNSLDINKRQIQMSIAPKTTKEDKEYRNRIDPIVSVTISQNLILQNNRLDKAIRILAQDVILNEINYLSEKESDIDETVASFWKNNINESYKQIQEFYSYGFGASEIIFDEKTGLPKELYQIPAETVFIKQESNREGTYSYYAIQKVNGKPDVKMKLSRYQYDQEDDDLPTCFWLGGGKTSEFYEIPYWLPAFNSISAKVALDELNAKKINEGNLMSGIVVIRRPTANMIRNNRLYFDNRINSERLRDLFNQYVYVHPDKEIMDEYPSPDELDSLGYAFMEIQKVIRL